MILDTPFNKCKNTPSYLEVFSYVNGILFAKRFTTPNFTRRSRQAIINSGELQWKDINPNIFGPMLQVVILTDQRGSLGQYYTSVPNIMKVIEALFLNALYETFGAARGNPKKLNELLFRLSNIKIFDLSCGSGFFLIIAYKELRKLEIRFIKSEKKIAYWHKKSYY